MKIPRGVKFATTVTVALYLGAVGLNQVATAIVAKDILRNVSTNTPENAKNRAELTERTGFQFTKDIYGAFVPDTRGKHSFMEHLMYSWEVEQWMKAHKEPGTPKV
jgi:hypothetical protein